MTNKLTMSYANREVALSENEVVVRIKFDLGFGTDTTYIGGSNTEAIKKRLNAEAKMAGVPTGDATWKSVTIIS